MYIHIYIYIWRERESYLYNYKHIYIYIYIERERDLRMPTNLISALLMRKPLNVRTCDGCLTNEAPTIH